MSWYNPLSWFRTVEAKVEAEVVSIERLALKEVDYVIAVIDTSSETLAGYRKDLADDIASKTATLSKVDEQLSKLQSVAPAPVPAPAPAPAPVVDPTPAPAETPAAV